MASLDDIPLPAKPWGKSKMTKLRKAIVEGDAGIDGLSYSDVYDWYMQIIWHIAEAVGAINLSGLDIREPYISYRVKTADTLRDKLIRTPGLQIPYIHDLMGIRFAGDMSLGTQDLLVERMSSNLPVHDVLDLRNNPHSGYRAVHLILKLSNGAFAELQVRTLFQDLWANCFELLADMYGRDIRYGGLPSSNDNGIVNIMLEFSKAFSVLENAEPEKYAEYRDDLLQKMKKLRDGLERQRDSMRESLYHDSQGA